MDIVQFELAIIGSIQAVVLALIARGNIQRKKQAEKTNQNAELRKKESLLMMGLVSASLQLGVSTAEAIRDGKTNGSMCRAMESAKKADKDYHDFTHEVAVEKMNKK